MKTDRQVCEWGWWKMGYIAFFSSAGLLLGPNPSLKFSSMLRTPFSVGSKRLETKNFGVGGVLATSLVFSSGPETVLFCVIESTIYSE